MVSDSADGGTPATNLPLLHVVVEALGLLAQRALALLRFLDVILELDLQLLAGGLELLQFQLDLFILRLVVCELLLEARAFGRRRG
jgi:hypothetical protein